MYVNLNHVVFKFEEKERGIKHPVSCLVGCTYVYCSDAEFLRAKTSPKLTARVQSIRIYK